MVQAAVLLLLLLAAVLVSPPPSPVPPHVTTMPLHLRTPDAQAVESSGMPAAPELL